MARQALERNHLSPTLWNIAGDCFFYSDDVAEAAEAYGQALTLSPRDVRSHLNLAWVAAHLDRPADALRYIAEGLALDHTCSFREALLAKQTEILDHQTQRHHDDLVSGLNRIRGHRDLPDA